MGKKRVGFGSEKGSGVVVKKDRGGGEKWSWVRAGGQLRREKLFKKNELSVDMSYGACKGKRRGGKTTFL